MKRLVIQRRAMRDLDAARAYYRDQAPHMLAPFALDVDAALQHVQRHPGTGSPRHGLQLGMAGLRSWLLRQFPYIVFYIELNDRIVVARILHQASDIPQHMHTA